jgi:porin
MSEALIGVRGTWLAGLAKVAVLGAILAALLGAAHGAAADTAKPPASIWQQERLTGDWGGARPVLAERGIEITVNYIGETFGVVSGGLQRFGVTSDEPFRRSTYEGRAEFTLDADLQKLIGWTGGKFHVTGYGIHHSGHNIGEWVGSIADPSNIDAHPTLRLFTLWFEQSFGDVVSVRVGQLAADDEFLVSETAGGLINGTFGWAGILAANMVSGGPAYPLATPGVRVKITPDKHWTLLAAVFSGDPAGPNCQDEPQICNETGTTFSLARGTLWIGELQYAAAPFGLPGVYKVGGWRANTDFPDQRFGYSPTGAVVSLADPSEPMPLNRRGNWGIYGVADQMVWRSGARSANLFVRGGVSPTDRNLLSYYVDGGAGFKGLLPDRPDDVLTIGAAFAKISPQAVALDNDTLAIDGPPFAIRDYELVLEASYQWQIAPWWILQPDLQLIVRPNGGQNPDDDTRDYTHVFVAGLRSTFKF